MGASLLNELDFVAIAEALTGQPRYQASALTGGVSAHTWKLDMADEQYVCRQSESINLQQEFLLLRELNSSPVPVPDVLLHNADRHYLVLKYIRGEVQYHWSRTKLDLAAKTLARIHSQNSTSVPTLKSPSQSLLTEPNRFYKVLEPLRSHLQGRAIKASNNPVLLHGDYWPGNMIWQEETLAAVIDWEDAHLGDPLVDLATTRMELGWLMDWQASLEFTQRYLHYNPVDTTDLFYWDCVVLDRLTRFVDVDLEDIALFFREHGHPELTAATIINQFHTLIEYLTADEPDSRQR